MASSIVPDELYRITCSAEFVKMPTSDAGPEVLPQVAQLRFGVSPLPEALATV